MAPFELCSAVVMYLDSTDFGTMPSPHCTQYVESNEGVFTHVTVHKMMDWQ